MGANETPIALNFVCPYFEVKQPTVLSCKQFVLNQLKLTNKEIYLHLQMIVFTVKLLLTCRIADSQTNPKDNLWPAPRTPPSSIGSCPIINNKRVKMYRWDWLVCFME